MNTIPNVEDSVEEKPRELVSHRGEEIVEPNKMTDNAIDIVPSETIKVEAVQLEEKVVEPSMKVEEILYLNWFNICK